MKPGKGSKYHSGYQTFRIRSFPYAGRPWLCRKRGRHITKSSPSFQCENCLFGYHKTFSPSLLTRNACHHVLQYRIGVHLGSLNSAVRQVLVPFRTFWCSIFVFVLLYLLFERSKWCEGSDFKPRFAVPALCRRRKNLCMCLQRRTRAWTGLERRGMIIGIYYRRKSPYLSTIMWGLLSKQRLTLPNSRCSTLLYLVIRKTMPKPRFNSTNITASLHLWPAIVVLIV